MLVCALTLAGVAVPGLAPEAASAELGQRADPLALLAVQQAQLTASDGAVSDYFGYSVALSGNTALVAASDADIGANTCQGSAYVFVRSGASWSQQQKLVASDGAAYDYFGFSVALAGDTALIGAPNVYVGANTYQGSAYVFVRSGSSWSQQQKLVASDGAAYDFFGYSVALAGDTALVAASDDDIGANTDQGSAYVFVRSGASWSQQQKLVASDGATRDWFGCSVALSGDTALIAAGEDDIGANTNQGSAYVFVRSGASWSQQQKVVASDGATEDHFGVSVALSGDTALVGVSSDDGARGSAYVFVRSGASWSQQQKLVASDRAAYDYFGSSVALAGDIALVGAYGDDTVANANQGSAYVYTRSGSSWGERQKLTASDGAEGDYFGNSVALAGDTALVGAWHDDIGVNASQGSVYVFALDLTAPTSAVTLTPAPNAAGWHHSPVTLGLSASDAGAGFDASFYRLGGGGNFSRYDPATKPLVSAEGATWIDYYSTDLAGNIESVKSTTVKIDSRKPATTAFPAGVKKGKRVTLRYQVNDPVPGSGQATVTLKIFKGKSLKKTLKLAGTRGCNVKQGYSWRCTLAKGSYRLEVYAIDLAGNVQSKVGHAVLTVK